MAKKPRDVMERFWSKVEKTDGCWIWRGKVTRDGYGQFDISGAKFGAHRVSFMVSHRQLQSGEWALHRCDNRVCVRPDHLFAGDSFANARDMAAKGRQVFQQRPERAPRGERNSKAKLTRAQVTEIQQSSESNKALARRFGVYASTVHRARTGRTWAAG